jgi:uncharacterized protein DUF4082/carboxypeptidase family protein
MTGFKLGMAMFLAVASQAVGQTGFWTTSTNPKTQQVTNDKAAVTLGLKFYSDVAGSVTGIRFYKGANNTGTHIGTLWSSSGAKLASVTFSGETASGWQQANFSSPVNITANAMYTVSYLAPNGYYACDQNYSWTTLAAPPLHVSGSSPGVFVYGSNTAFPNGTWNRSNYWVDVLFRPTGTTTPPPTSIYTISGTAAISGATVTLSGAASRSATAGASGSYSFSNLPNGSYVVAPSMAGYTFSPSTASVSISGASKTGVNFTATAVPNPIPHTVSLSWKASTSSNVTGYNVYRASVAGGAYTKMTAAPMAGTAWIDRSVVSGRTYYYVATTVDGNSKESGYSNLATAVVPTP